MEITGSGHEIAEYINETVLSRTKEYAEKSSKSADTPLESKEDAIVNLSEASKEVQRAMQSEPEVRMEKVQAIKDKIEQGTYEIDYDKTAEKMLKAFFEEMI
ncbi:MAG: flagellar biosynthesis anti-sigma factor FlgM [Desulfobacterales bacterium]|nr:flagellar biosynthesis anti-sigma factor FlgM [Desulfobacterales bacterium]